MENWEEGEVKEQEGSKGNVEELRSHAPFCCDKW